ncbi:MAG: hypothetical protein AAFR63_15710 [Cyanobacteria bacterium J06631_6]
MPLNIICGRLEEIADGIIVATPQIYNISQMGARANKTAKSWRYWMPAIGA